MSAFKRRDQRPLNYQQPYNARPHQRDASAAADLNTVGGSPFLTALVSTWPDDAGFRPRLPPTLRPWAMKTVRLLREPVGIAIRHVDLVFDSVKGEANGLGCVRAVDVVLQGPQYLGRHGGSFFPRIVLDGEIVAC